MGLLEAVSAAGILPAGDSSQKDKKRYSEVLSQQLAQELAAALRAIGFQGVKPLPGGPGERAFQGGLGPKKVDVSHADERHGLLLAVSIKSITSAPFGKNLKNRFYDLCPEGITLHLSFPYSVVCALFCFPSAANEDFTPGRPISTFERARKLLSIISGRQEYTDPGEKFENITMMLFQPAMSNPAVTPWVKLVDTLSNREMTEAEYLDLLLAPALPLRLGSNREMTEAEYLDMIRQIYNRRNPHAAIGEDIIDIEEEYIPRWAALGCHPRRSIYSPGNVSRSS